MEISEYKKKFKQAQEMEDPAALLRAMQEFYSEIYTIDHTSSEKLLGLYSTAQQLEKLGLDSMVIKQAIRAHVESKYRQYPFSWEPCRQALNSLLESDRMEPIPSV